MYRAPVKDIRFVLDELLGTEQLRACPEFAEFSSETSDAVLGEAARFAESVLEPLCKSGDRQGAKWSPNGVTMPDGFKEAYQHFCESGWPSLRAPPEFGGQGVPAVLGTAVEELWASSNLAFKLCPMLTQGAIEALTTPDEFVVTDQPYLAFLAERKVPPELVDTAISRIRSRSLTSSKAQTQAAAYQPRVVLFWATASARWAASRAGSRSTTRW